MSVAWIGSVVADIFSPARSPGFIVVVGARRTCGPLQLFQALPVRTSGRDVL